MSEKKLDFHGSSMKFQKHISEKPLKEKGTESGTYIDFGGFFFNKQTKN